VRSGVGDEGVELELQKQGPVMRSKGAGFSGWKETMSGGLELRLTGVEWWRQGSSAAGKNGGRKEAFGHRG
jgi:hypothetical protein